MRYSQRNSIHSVIGKRSLQGLLWLILLLLIIFTGEAMAQNCGNNVPKYYIDMTGSPDSVVTITDKRKGNCCSQSNCIYFSVTLDTFAHGIIVDVSGGTGNTYYNINRGNSTPIGNMFCVNGTGPHEITVCKPGGNQQTYTIRSIEKPRHQP